MTTATASTATEAAVFRHQARVTDQVLRLNLAGVTQEESLIQPTPGGNCLNWVVGHLVWTYNEALQMLGQEPVKEKDALQRYARGSAPIQESAEALQLSDLLAIWDEASRRVDAGLAGLTAEVLDRPAPNSPSNDPNETMRSLVSTILFHQAYHTGQTGVLRRLAGKDGAIA